MSQADPGGTRREEAASTRDGILGRSAIQHRNGAGTSLDRRRRAQWSSSISLWVLTAILFFIPYGLVINELSSRFPVEGGLYVWAKEAFGDFHGFVAGWNYWIYTIFYFPGLLLASASMSAYIMGSGGVGVGAEPDVSAGGVVRAADRGGGAEHHRTEYRKVAAERGRGLHLRAAADAGGDRGLDVLASRIGDALHLGHDSPAWNWDTVNFWSQIAFAFTGLELVSAMSEEIRDPQRTLPRALLGRAS